MSKRGPKPLPLYVRFWIRVDKRGPDECWPWGGKPRPAGYGEINIEGRAQLAHRVAFLLTYGHWPREARHSCDNPICCNPAHVLDGSHKDNMRDMVERGRCPNGDRHWNAKLTAAQVEAVRADPRTQRMIAADYGISQQHVSALKHRARRA